jgi:uncharacterized membrane protein YjjB (DUF3815 family)
MRTFWIPVFTGMTAEGVARFPLQHAGMTGAGSAAIASTGQPPMPRGTSKVMPKGA